MVEWKKESISRAVHRAMKDLAVGRQVFVNRVLAHLFEILTNCLWLWGESGSRSPLSSAKFHRTCAKFHRTCAVAIYRRNWAPRHVHNSIEHVPSFIELFYKGCSNANPVSNYFCLVSHALIFENQGMKNIPKYTSRPDRRTRIVIILGSR